MTSSRIHPRNTAARSAVGRAAALLAASVAFASLATVVTHEFGHWLLDRARGAEVRVVAPPFGAPHIEAVRPITVDVTGWPDAAGPLANVLVGIALFAALWRWRRPLLLPLLLWGPVALLQESVNALVQLGTRAPGTDLIRLVAVGVPAWTLVTGAVIGLGFGLIGLVALLPTMGLPADVAAWRRFAVLAVGLAAYPALGLALTPAFSGASPQRNATLLVFGVLIAAFVTALAGLARSAWPWFRRRGKVVVPVQAPWTALAAAAVLHVAALALA